jgi:hypothetical protein
LLFLGVILTIVPGVKADVGPPPQFPPTVVMSGSADFPEMVFVVYRIKEDNPWAPGFRVDPATAKVVPSTDGVELDAHVNYAVLAVPRKLADKTKGIPDASWLEASAPGVIRVPGVFQVRSVFAPVTLRYQLAKNGTETELTLLNPEDLQKAQRYPERQYAVDRSADGKASPKDYTWVYAAGGGVVLLGGILAFWLFKRS